MSESTPALGIKGVDFDSAIRAYGSSGANLFQPDASYVKNVPQGYVYSWRDPTRQHMDRQLGWVPMPAEWFKPSFKDGPEPGPVVPASPTAKPGADGIFYKSHGREILCVTRQDVYDAYMDRESRKALNMKYGVAGSARADENISTNNGLQKIADGIHGWQDQGFEKVILGQGDTSKLPIGMNR